MMDEMAMQGRKARNNVAVNFAARTSFGDKEVLFKTPVWQVDKIVIALVKEWRQTARMF